MLPLAPVSEVYVHPGEQEVPPGWPCGLMNCLFSKGTRPNHLKVMLIMTLWLVLCFPARADIIYEIKQGDTAWSIAIRFGVSLSELYLANGWAEDEDPLLRIGQHIAIPSHDSPGSQNNRHDSDRKNPLDNPSKENKYIVKAGDNPYLIAYRLHIKPLALLEYNGLTEDDLLSIGQVLKIPPSDYQYKGEAEKSESASQSAAKSASTYEIREGDSPWSISRRFGVPLSAFLSINNLTESSILRVGTKVLLPSLASNMPSRSLWGEYTVQDGDTLDSIALANGVPLISLLEANQLKVNSSLTTGQVLKIPGYRAQGRNTPLIAEESVVSPAQDFSANLTPLPSLNSGSLESDDEFESEIFDFRKIPIPKASSPDLTQEAAKSQWSVDGYFEDGKAYHKYSIRRGDTIGEIARAFKVTQSEIINRNGLSTRSMLRIGRDLKIPLDIPIRKSKRNNKNPSNFKVGAPSGPIGTGQGSANGRAVVEEAMKYLGTPYVWSGSSLTGGSDCSGFVMAVYSLFGVSLPHRSRDQASYGKPVDYSELQPGDLVFFHTTRSGISHVGIYIGNGDFVHSSSHHGGVTVSPMDSGYYRQRFVCARRVF